MVSQKLTVKNEQGLHMRPAGVLSKAMAAFEASASVKFNNASYDAKSIMMLMTACIKCGSEIEIVCDGPDEENALKTAVDLFESGFNE